MIHRRVRNFVFAATTFVASTSAWALSPRVYYTITSPVNAGSNGAFTVTARALGSLVQGQPGADQGNCQGSYNSNTIVAASRVVGFDNANQEYFADYTFNSTAPAGSRAYFQVFCTFPGVGNPIAVVSNLLGIFVVGPAPSGGGGPSSGTFELSWGLDQKATKGPYNGSSFVMNYEGGSDYACPIENQYEQGIAGGAFSTCNGVRRAWSELNDVRVPVGNADRMMSAWVRLPIPSPERDRFLLFGYGADLASGTVDGHFGLYVKVDSNSGSLAYRLYFVNGATTIKGPLLPSNKWTFVGVTATSGKIQLYLDQQLMGEDGVCTSKEPCFKGVPVTLNTAPNSAMKIAGTGYTDFPIGAFSIDELILANSSFTPWQMTQGRYKAVYIPDFGFMSEKLKALFNGEDLVFNPIAGGGITAGYGVTTTSGRIGKAYYFGSNRSAPVDSVRSGSADLPAGSKSRVISGWIMPYSTQQYAGNQAFAFGYDVPDTTGGISNANKTFAVGMRVAASCGNQYCYCAYNLATQVCSPTPVGAVDQWTHVAAEYYDTSATTGVMTLYINGVQVASTTNTAASKISTPFGAGFSVGHVNTGGSTNRFMTGLVDGVRVWDAILSNGQHTLLYNLEKP